MAKYTGADCRLCRREGVKLYLKGDRCASEKCSIAKRKTLPGQHGAGRKKNSEYALQLREKQKCKRIYGLLEKQFHSYYEKSEIMRGITGDNMLCLIERRLDNVVYRLGFGTSRAMSRQLVNHGLIAVNGKVINIPSYLTKAGEIISVKESKKDKPVFEEVKKITVVSSPEWLSVNYPTLTGKIERLPTREDVTETIAEHMIVELYSK